MGGGVAPTDSAAEDYWQPSAEADISPDERTKRRVQHWYHRRNLAAFWLLGFFNNYYYCVVLSAAESIAEGFGLKSYIALVSWAEIIGGIVVRMVNGFVLSHLGYNWRVVGFALQSTIGVALVCVAPFCGTNDPFRFFLSLVGISFIGNASCYGESALLGYMDKMPPRTLAGWSAGTGLSGVAASLVYLALKAAPSMSTSVIFLVNAPSIAMYCFAFYRLVVPVTLAQVRDVGLADLGEGDAPVDPVRAGFRPRSLWSTREEWGRLSCRPPIAPPSAASADDPEAALQEPAAAPNLDSWVDMCNRETGCGAAIFRAVMPGIPFSVIRAVHSAIAINCLNLMLVYVFEYGVQFMAPFCFPTEPKHHDAATAAPGDHTTTSTAPTSSPGVTYDWGTQNAFVLSQFCYQLGVLCSRSSLQIIRIRRVHILTILQAINFVFWVAQAKAGFLSSKDDPDRQRAFTGILLTMMVYVGLMGGASYVNVFFNILSDKELFASAEDDGASDDSNATVLKKRSVIRQLAMNIGAMYATAGITLGALVDVVLANTFV